MRLRELIGDTEIRLQLVEGDVWADAALAHIRALEPEHKNAWAELLMNCLRVSGSKPSKKWMKEAESFITTIGPDEYRSALLTWFPLVSEPRPEPGGHYEYQ